MKAFIEDIKYVLHAAFETWKYRRHLRAGGNPDQAF